MIQKTLYTFSQETVLDWQTVTEIIDKYCKGNQE